MDSTLLVALVQAAQDLARDARGELVMVVTLGDMISTGGPIIAIVGSYLRLRDRINGLEVKMALLWEDYERRQAYRDERRYDRGTADDDPV